MNTNEQINDTQILANINSLMIAHDVVVKNTTNKQSADEHFIDAIREQLENYNNFD